MIKVLHVLGGLGLGGAESRIMDLYRHIDRNIIQFDFMVHMDPSEYKRAVAEGIEPASFRKPQHYDDEIRELGGSIYALPCYRVINHPEYKKAADRFFKEHHDYNVVQGHMTSTGSIYLSAARRYRADDPPYMFTVAHTRNAGVSGGLKGLAVRCLRRSLPDSADRLFACSHLAGDETFGGASYTYIPNTIDTDRFVFSMTDRKEIRSKYGIPDDGLLIGNVARFESQKNQPFLIRAFAGMRNRDNAYLIFCGDGPDRQSCEELCDRLGIADKVIFAGRQKEMPKYYSSMDVFAFPSVYEGLPGVVVEAQTSGLYCMISDTITTDVIVSDRIDVIGIQDTSVWTASMDELADRLPYGAKDKGQSPEQGSDDRRSYVGIMKNAGFDVAAQAKMMSAFYLDPVNAEIT
ncbi:MAG: glycosyltransferase [Lachnospiraceae bacterium]|nr:glycosyltransferase [Lachnospiraceae bacterium]